MPGPRGRELSVARSLRRRETTWERKLWKHLRRDQLGFHFRRQHMLGGFILDFYCHEARLCIELDGEGHGKWHAREDRERDAALDALGVATIRIPNQDVILDLAAALERIRSECCYRATELRPYREEE